MIKRSTSTARLWPRHPKTAERGSRNCKEDEGEGGEEWLGMKKKWIEKLVVDLQFPIQLHCTVYFQDFGVHTISYTLFCWFFNRLHTNWDESNEWWVETRGTIFLFQIVALFSPPRLFECDIQHYWTKPIYTYTFIKMWWIFESKKEDAMCCARWYFLNMGIFCCWDQFNGWIFWGPHPWTVQRGLPKRRKWCETMRKKRDLKSRYGKTVVRSLTRLGGTCIYVRIRKRASRRILKGLFFEQSDVLFVCEVMCIFSELRNSKSMNLYVFVLKPLISFSC